MKGFFRLIKTLLSSVSRGETQETQRKDERNEDPSLLEEILKRQYGEHFMDS